MEDKAKTTSAEPLILLRRSDVERMTSLSKTSIYNLINDGEFPAPIRLLDNKVAWVQTEIQEWIIEKIYKRDCRSKI
ncbi:AlpA family phage regulatory protein [Polynucleobacter sp. JS-Safj-400b-B2]|uniref:helix-turn-helix transcriptional regulator n=1 Tax=Polynucleobacter sp. JS-Safj-400b-B2 TaxID=2576921 RepID=UPI001C0BAB28|nr:AlpA family phage regulatory protein [Polynucleobacter sp. JS-Safj-400b-B2]